jgi:hypothetical protein
VLLRDLISVPWQNLLGLVLTALGFVFVLNASRNAARRLAVLLGLLGLLLLGVAIVLTMLGFSLFGGFGSLFREAVGLIFCVAAYAIMKWGSGLLGYGDDRL